MTKRMHTNSMLSVVLVGAGLFTAGPAAAQTLLSGFDSNLGTSLGPSWTTSLPHSFVSQGATQGASALALTHGTGWTQDFLLDGGGDLATLIAGSSKFEIDATTPATTTWRQLFIVMQGAGQTWSQHQFDLAAGATSTQVLDLNATGIRAAAAAGDKSWWQINLIFQGGDNPNTAQVVTTLDNIRLTPVPEPGLLALGAAALAGLIAVRRRRASLGAMRP